MNQKKEYKKVPIWAYVVIVIGALSIFTFPLIFMLPFVFVVGIGEYMGIFGTGAGTIVTGIIVTGVLIIAEIIFFIKAVRIVVKVKKIQISSFSKQIHVRSHENNDHSIKRWNDAQTDDHTGIFFGEGSIEKLKTEEKSDENEEILNRQNDSKYIEDSRKHEALKNKREKNTSNFLIHQKDKPSGPFFK